MIAPGLWEFMFSKSRKSAIILPVVFFFLTIFFGILSLSGPVWKKVEVPGMKSTSVLSIFLDMSWSMMAEDIKPNRLERAKLKIRDLLQANSGARTSLWVYAGTVHPVMPLTSDYKLIIHHVDHLKANIMPVRGDDLNLAMTFADTIFRRLNAPSTLLIITDEVETLETNELFDFVNNTPHKIEILTMSTPSGAAVPGFRRNDKLRDSFGKEVVSRADPGIWQQLHQHSKITVNPLTLDKSDVEGIAKRIRKNLTFQLEGQESDEEWQDEGLLFLAPTLLFGMFFFRKGWMIQWCLLLCAFLFTSCEPENKYADLWYSGDFKARKLEEKGKFIAAADSYEDLPHKAVAYYKGGDYEAAASLFAMDSSAKGLYNYGLALANLGSFEEARRAFDSALEKDPNLKQAENSVKQLKVAMAMADSINRYKPVEAKKEENKGPLVERKAQSEDEELTSDTEVEELPEEGDRITDEVESNMIQAEELERPPDDIQAGRQEEAQNILLRSISAEPTEFLKRRFKFQKEKYFPEVKEGDKKW